MAQCIWSCKTLNKQIGAIFDARGMLIKRRTVEVNGPLASEIMPREIFESRWQFIQQLAVG
jgi:hypothetical protein